MEREGGVTCQTEVEAKENAQKVIEKNGNSQDTKVSGT